MTSLLRLLRVLGLGLLPLLLFAAPVRADEEAAARIELSAAPRPPTKGVDVTGHYLLTATLLTADGKPVANQPVAFTQPVDFFGPRSVHLGTAVTDSTGTAVLLYQPAQGGQQTVEAYVAGAADAAPVSATLTFEPRTVMAPFEAEPLPLATLRKWLPIGVGILVLGTWIVLIGVFLSATMGIRAAARRDSASPVRASAQI